MIVGDKGDAKTGTISKRCRIAVPGKRQGGRMKPGAEVGSGGGVGQYDVVRSGCRGVGERRRQGSIRGWCNTSRG